MDVVGAAICSFSAYASTTVLMYPYRDMCKMVTNRDLFPVKDPANFALSRYKGMMTNPGIPATIAAPPTALYTSYIATYSLTGSAMFAGAIAGTSHAAAKRAVKVYSHRMSQQTHKGPEYPTAKDAIIRGTKTRGAFAWVQGTTPLIAPHVLWYGIPLVTLTGRRDGPYGRSFFGDFYAAFKIHSFCSLLSVPFRNLFRPVLHRVDYSPIFTVNEFLAAEKALYYEAYVTGSRMLREAGPLSFFSGNVRAIFVSSVPWCVGFAMYRAFGGPI